MEGGWLIEKYGLEEDARAAQLDASIVQNSDEDEDNDTEDSDSDSD